MKFTGSHIFLIFKKRFSDVVIGRIKLRLFWSCYYGKLGGREIIKEIFGSSAFPKAYCLSGICLLLLSAIEHPAVFSVIYLLLYFFTGVGDTALLTSLNEKIPPYLRATVLSCQSFTFRGRYDGAAISGLSVNSLTISGLWFIGGCIFTINMGIVYALQKWSMR